MGGEGRHTAGVRKEGIIGPTGWSLGGNNQDQRATRHSGSAQHLSGGTGTRGVWKLVPCPEHQCVSGSQRKKQYKEYQSHCPGGSWSAEWGATQEAYEI